jgi:hypothetical protein
MHGEPRRLTFTAAKRRKIGFSPDGCMVPRRYWGLAPTCRHPGPAPIPASRRGISNLVAGRAMKGKKDGVSMSQTPPASPIMSGSIPDPSRLRNAWPLRTSRLDSSQAWQAVTDMLGVLSSFRTFAW